jgi:hypothetical protein
MRLLIWLLFGVCSAVLPLLLTGIIMFDHDKFKQVSDTWSGGELILISMTLLMASLGDLIVYESKYPPVKALTTVISFFLIIVAAVWYMDVFSGLITTGRSLKGGFSQGVVPVVFRILLDYRHGLHNAC